jgi:WD40 repeat protein
MSGILSRSCCLLALLVVAVHAERAVATKIDMHPRPTLLLSKSGTFIAQDTPRSVALYRLTDGKLLHRFQSPEHTDPIDATADEKFLALCGGGSIGVWDIATGRMLWQKSRFETGIDHIYDVSFARNGKSFLVSPGDDRAIVYGTDSGKIIRTIRFPPQQGAVMSAALAPDGLKGVLVDLGNDLFTFDVATTALTPMKLKGAWPGGREVCRLPLRRRSRRSARHPGRGSGGEDA